VQQDLKVIRVLKETPENLMGHPDLSVLKVPKVLQELSVLKVLRVVQEPQVPVVLKEPKVLRVIKDHKVLQVHKELRDRHPTEDSKLIIHLFPIH